jgi:hypothetical protein
MRHGKSLILRPPRVSLGQLARRTLAHHSKYPLSFILIILRLGELYQCHRLCIVAEAYIRSFHFLSASRWGHIPYCSAIPPGSSRLMRRFRREDIVQSLYTEVSVRPYLLCLSSLAEFICSPCNSRDAALLGSPSSPRPLQTSFPDGRYFRRN